MAEVASAATKIIAAWAVALAVFIFFGFLQVHWQVGRERPELMRLDQQIDALRRQRLQALRGDLRDLRQTSPEDFGFEEHVVQVPGRPGRALALDLCVGLTLLPSAPGTSGAEAGPERARQSARNLCKQIADTQQELKELEALRDKLVVAVREVQLKTPLFETKVVSLLAPLAALALLLAAIFYLDQKRRELLALYLAAVVRAGLDIGSSADQVARFNQQVRQHFGVAPIWLLPFPLVPKLHPSLRVEDALGASGRRPEAVIGAALAVLSVSALAAWLFFAAVNLNLDAFHRSTGVPRAAGRIDTGFLVALGLACAVIVLAITTALPWSPTAEPATGGQRQRLPLRRRALLGMVLVSPVVVPAAAILTDRQAVVRDQITALGRWPWMRRALSSLLPSNRRARLRLRWRGRWTGTTLAVGFFETTRPASRPSQPPAWHRLTSVLQKPSPGAMQRLLLLRSPVRLADGARLKAVSDHAALAWLEASVGMLACPAPHLPRARLRLPDLSIQIEAAALRLHQGGQPDAAQRILRFGRHRLQTTKASNRLQAISSALRLYDLAAVLALKQGGAEGAAELNRLADELEQRLSAIQLPPLVPGAAALEPKYAAVQRRRRGRRPDAASEERFLARRLYQRISNWRAPGKRWREKWTAKAWTVALSPRLLDESAPASRSLPVAGRRN